MKAVTFAGNSRVDVRDVALPDLQPGEVLVKVAASAICGSEMKSYRHAEPCAGNPGHEMVGVVVESRGGNGPAVGDRVAVNIITGCGHCPTCRNGDRRFCAEQGYIFNGHAVYVAVPVVNCMPLPDDLPYRRGGPDRRRHAGRRLSRPLLHRPAPPRHGGCRRLRPGRPRLRPPAELLRRSYHRRRGQPLSPGAGLARGRGERHRSCRRRRRVGHPRSHRWPRRRHRHRRQRQRRGESTWPSMRPASRAPSSSPAPAATPRSTAGPSSWKRKSSPTASGTSSTATTMACWTSIARASTSPI